MILPKIHLTILFVFIPLVVFTACDQEDIDISKSLSEGSWTISEITSNSATPAPTALIGTEVTFADGGVEMSGPCNQMGGFYEVDEAGTVTRSEVHMTLKDCGSMDEQEVVLLRYFQESSQLSFDSEQLIMQSSQGEIHFVQNSVEVTRSVELAPPSPTPVVCTPLPNDMTMDVEAKSETEAVVRLNGLQSGESLSFIFIEEIPGQRRSIIESYPVDTVDETGSFEFTQPGLTPLDNTGPNSWEVQVVHARGVACTEITLP